MGFASHESHITKMPSPEFHPKPAQSFDPSTCNRKPCMPNPKYKTGEGSNGLRVARKANHEDLLRGRSQHPLPFHFLSRSDRAGLGYHDRVRSQNLLLFLRLLPSPFFLFLEVLVFLVLLLFVLVLVLVFLFSSCSSCSCSCSCASSASSSASSSLSLLHHHILLLLILFFFIITIIIIIFFFFFLINLVR